MKKVVLFSLLVLLVPSCIKGQAIKDVDFPATPIDMTKIKKVGKACFKITPFNTSGASTIIEAAKNAEINKVYMVEYSDEFESGGFVQKKCTTVYGE